MYRVYEMLGAEYESGSQKCSPVAFSLVVLLLLCSTRKGGLD